MNVRKPIREPRFPEPLLIRVLPRTALILYWVSSLRVVKEGSGTGFRPRQGSAPERRSARGATEEAEPRFPEKIDTHYPVNKYYYLKGTDNSYLLASKCSNNNSQSLTRNSPSSIIWTTSHTNSNVLTGV